MKATNIARNMVTQWGMSERLGPRTFGNKQELVFLGREIGEQRNYSEKVAEEIDEEVRRLVDHAYQTARNLLIENRDRLDKLVKVLLDKETIEGDDLKRVLDGLDIEEPPAPTQRRPEPDEETAGRTRRARRARSRRSARPDWHGDPNRTSRWNTAIPIAEQLAKTDSTKGSPSREPFSFAYEISLASVASGQGERMELFRFSGRGHGLRPPSRS